MRKVYIQAAVQISIQEPLSERWMTEPVEYTEPFVHAIDPVFHDYIDSNSARRMSPIMKRALVTSVRVLHDTGIEHPDAIITGTSIGCLDHVEKFISSIAENDEQLLKPTFFMQSTHNTVGSTLGIYTKTTSYNTTMSHGGISFDLTVHDAWVQMQLGKINNALVGGHEEMIDHYFNLIRKIGYVGVPGMYPCSEVAMAMVLNTDEKNDNLCELAGIDICHSPSMERLSEKLNRLLDNAGISFADIGYVMTGVNGNQTNDVVYDNVAKGLLEGKPLLRYKNLFGENYTVSALGVYAAAHCLNKGFVPESMIAGRGNAVPLNNMLVINHDEENNFSMILLKRICC